MTGFFGFSSNCGEPEDFPDDDATGEAMKVTRMKFFPDGHVEELITETTAAAPDAPAAREVTAIVRQDWRYRHEYAVEHNREGVDTLTSDLDVAKARVASVLDSLGRKGSAGVWLDNDSLLAIRHVLVALAARVPVEGER